MLRRLNSFFVGTLKTHTNAHAVRGRPTLKDVERQFRYGSVLELKETQMCSNVTEMAVNIENDASQNTNSLISRYLVENYSEDDSDNESNLINKVDARLESSEDKRKLLARRTSSFILGFMLVLLTRKISFLSVALFCFCC